MPEYIAAALERDPEKEKKPKLWEFQDSLVFERFDSFVGRLNTVREFFKTAQQFLKLEKVEIGGIRGRALSGRVAGVHEEFKVNSQKSSLDCIYCCYLHIRFEIEFNACKITDSIFCLGALQCICQQNIRWFRPKR